ncbi:MFS transporter [Rhizobium halophytocola]|uniref:MFS family permease n=1 Tax=Rhizobium halophytocola TaxID=735519 RepID=A0ABS4E4M7_9HYPH|nr:MFS transporter [Rhizobium halophytocola]MBP1852903.1 MFS family permease [Rhizobium halophytocola]
MPDRSFPSRPCSGWYAVVVLCLALLLSYTDRLIINLVVDPIKAELALTDLEVSFLQGAGFALIFALAGLPCGRLADAVSRRNLIAAGLLLWSIATICCGLALDFSSFFAARIAVGLGEAALVPAASSLIIDLFSPRRRGIALGVFSLGATFGAGGAILIGGILLGWIDDGQFAAVPFAGALAAWRQLFIVVGLPGLVLLPLLLLIGEPARRNSSGLLPISKVFRILIADNGTVLRVCLVKGVLAIGDNGIFAWMPTLLQRVYDLSALEVGGLVALAVSGSGAIASLIGGALSDRFARRWGTQARIVLLMGCYSLAVVGAIVLYFAESGAQAAMALGIWAFGSIAGYVIGHVVMQEHVPSEMRATTIALSLTAIGLVGISLGPTLVPVVASALSGAETALQSAMALVGLFSALLCFVVIWPPVRNGLLALTNGPKAR